MRVRPENDRAFPSAFLFDDAPDAPYTSWRVGDVVPGFIHPNSNKHMRGPPAVKKNDLVASVASDTGLSKADAAKAVDSVFDSISRALSNGSDVRLVGFGTFSVVERRASEGRNPRTGESIHIPASRQPRFKAGKTLKNAVN